jgi:hypothetical protein
MNLLLIKINYIFKKKLFSRKILYLLKILKQSKGIKLSGQSDFLRTKNKIDFSFFAG